MPFCETCPIRALQEQNRALPITDQGAFCELAGRAMTFAHPEDARLIGAWGGLEHPPDMDDEARLEFVLEQFGPAWLRAKMGAVTGRQVVQAAVECVIRDDLE